MADLDYHVPAITCTPAWQRTSLVLPPDLTYDDWAAMGHTITGMGSSIPWWTGDFMLYGEAKFGDKASSFVEPKAAQTLLNCAWVCSRFPPSRRRENLSFSHHAEVAACPYDVADAWLHQAEVNGWSKTQLREAVRASKGLPEAKDKPDDTDWAGRCASLQAALDALKACPHCGAVLQEDRP